MKRSTLFGQLFPAFIYISLLSFIAVSVFACLQFRDFYFKQAHEDLKSWVELAVKTGPIGKSDSPEELRDWVSSLGAGTRTSIISDKGILLVDSVAGDDLQETMLDRPEIAQALQTGVGQSIRKSEILQSGYMNFALKIVHPGMEIVVLRGSRPMDRIYSRLHQVYWQIAIAGILVTTMMALYSWWFSKRISLPLEQMKEQAIRVAGGDFKGRIHVGPGIASEVEELGRSMNDISIKIDKRYQALSTQKNQQEAVFSSMVEGVVAVDPGEKIMYLNEAATKILDLGRDVAVGSSIQESIRIPEIQRFISQSLQQSEPGEKDIELPGGIGSRVNQTVILQLRSSALLDSKNRRIGTVLVFNDITKMRKLESHRRDFVSNVSHELRTPLTSIQGFAETLLNTNVQEEDKYKFLEIIHKHATRLNAIIEDLLALSRFEKDVEEGAIDLKSGAIQPAIAAAIELCQMKASKRSLTISFEGEEDLKASLNQPLLEQALVNLIDNALKFSEEGQEVEVGLHRNGREAQISVKDHGQGISSEHLPRLFERFYRVDKARSRKLGGTGLGLSIVKHVTNAHKGRLDVESELGLGTKFSIYLPVEDPPSLC